MLMLAQLAVVDVQVLVEGFRASTQAPERSSNTLAAAPPTAELSVRAACEGARAVRGGVRGQAGGKIYCV